MIFDLLNISNNAYDHAFQRYVKPQNPDVLKLVEGTWRRYSPNRRYTDETPAQRGLIKRFKMGLPMDPRSKAAAIRLIAKGAPHWHDPDKSWALEDRNPRNPAARPTSSALGKIRYNPSTQVVNFQFRTKNGGLGKTYTSLMNGEAFYRWVGKSRSIGKYFNRYLKGRMTPAG